MQVDLELKPIEWSSTQGCTYVNDEWILLYQLNDQNFSAECVFIKCSKLDAKHGLCRDIRYETGEFLTMEEAKQACEAHFRELMLKAFLQVV